MEETTKQIIISKVKFVKDGIRINYEKYRDSYWDTLQLTSVLVCCRHILSPMRKEGIPWRIKE